MVLYAAAAFISLALLDRVMLGPVLSKMKSLDQQVSDKETAIKNKLRIVSQKDKIMKEIQKYETYSMEGKSQEEEVTALLKEIEIFASKSSVYLIDVKPRGVKDGEYYKEYMIDLNCEAQMEQIIAFMYLIESSPKIFNINDYVITPKSKESSILSCRMIISKIVVP